ncbi:MAG: prolyl oligopeptidase family serine peptidase, partial [Kiritimatiellae bacterium]|nr:prolyl oligopeptidase family serine peptidase [Kiritimatiellia bacterium]
AGFVVLCPTARGFGERGAEYPHSCDVFALKASLMGLNLLALNLYDFMRGLDYLHVLPYVDPKRTGCVGLSNGGTFSLHLAAIDTRVQAACVSGAVGSWREQMWHGYACGNQFFHGVLRYADIPDVIALIAPRSLCIESGLYDSCFMSSSFRGAHAKIREAFRVAGCPERLCIDEFAGVHRFRGDKSIPFLLAELA